MHDHPIAETEFLSRLDGDGTVLRLVVGERCEAERISGEEAVSARVPAYRVVRVLRIVEDRDADLLALDVARIVAPVGRLAPEFLLTDEAIGVGELTGGLVLD